jgi:branched-subunit amino acid transport protein AzlD
VNSGYVLLVLLAMMAVTFALRALPFVAAQWLQKHPFVQRLGDFLPLSIMTLLVLHSGAGAAAHNPLSPWPEGVAIAVTAVLQWRLRHPLFSILCGTALYVAWRNGMF